MNVRKSSSVPLISVIVPVYNDSSFLCRCVDSILGQTYKKLEILLVDDGSSDGSGIICDEYALKDQRVRSYHKLNGGTVSARKYGLDNAQGQLISFIDGDDWIDSEMYEKLIVYWQQNKCPDIVSSGLIFEIPKFNTKRKICDNADERRYDRAEIVDKLLPELISNLADGQGMVLTTVCSKLIDKAVAIEAMQYMDESLSIGEDGAYVYFLMACCTSFFVVHSAFYHYEKHENSQNYNRNIDNISKLFQLKKVMTEGMRELNWNSQIHEQIKHYVWGYLYRIIKENFQFEIEQFFYLFPFSRCSQGGTVLIYGAGKVGNAYMQCLINSKFAKRIIWVDQNYKKFQAQGKDVISIEEALQEEYDYIVIALENEKIAVSIKEALLNQGVPCAKLVWEKPIRIYFYK